MKIKNQNTLPSKYVLLILVVVCGILLGAERFMDGGGPLSWIANYTIVPMQRGISYVGTWMSDLTDNFATLSDLRKENEQLQERVDQLTIDNTRLSQEQYENRKEQYGRAAAKSRLMLDALQEAEGLSTEDEEYQEGLEKLAESYGVDADTLVASYGQNTVEQYIMTSRVLDRLLSYADITDETE